MARAKPRRRSGSRPPAVAAESPRRPALKKRLGQHHLHSGETCHKAIEFLQIAGRPVVEIGPGGGVLTRELLSAGAKRVLGLELDRDWAFYLKTEQHAALDLVVADALDTDWSLVSHWAQEPRMLLAGNLPYQVGTAIVLSVLDRAPCFERAAFLVQLEVADRLTAKPGDSAYGSLSVLVAARSHAQRISRVRPGAFHPPPKVESAFVGFSFSQPRVPDEDWPGFKKTVRGAFANRRKTLSNSLSVGWGKDVAKRCLERAGINAKRRAETLCLEEFMELAREAKRISGDGQSGS